MTDEKYIVKIDDEDLFEVIPGYLDSCRTTLGIMQQSMQQGDFETLKRQGHNIKGSGGGYGFDRISEMGLKIENAAKVQDGVSIDQEIILLQDYLNRVEVVLCV